MRKYKIICLSIATFWAFPLFGQVMDSSNFEFMHLGLSTGISKYSSTDEYISESRYTGSYSPLSLNWNRFREGRGFHLGVHITEITNFKNDGIPNLTASVQNFKFFVNRYYALNPITIFGKDSRIYLGHGNGIEVYDRRQNIASGGSLENNVTSLFIQFPLRLNFRLYFPISQKWNLIGDSSIPLLSASLRSDVSDDFVFQVLALNKHFQVQFDLTLQYSLNNRFLSFVSLKNEFTRNTGWKQDLYISQTGGEVGLILNLIKK